MAGSELQALLAVSPFEVTARVQNDDESDPVTADDGVSVVLSVDTVDGTHFDFVRQIDELGAGNVWEHTWPIEGGAVRHADASVRDGTGSVLAMAQADA
jgi:hypothetical protein